MYNNNIIKTLTRSEQETENLGAKLAESLQPGMILAFRGGLGMGKTAFTRGIAHGLGYPGRVSSPTFTLVQEYIGGKMPVFHFDWYRIQDAEELYNLGWEEYWDRGGVCVVEWSERALDALPPDVIRITIARADEYENANAHENENKMEADTDSRWITIEGVNIP